jgi:two-component system, cell cycle sensor histidine kinase and response regulator CckA
VAQEPDLLRVVGEAVMALGTDIVFVIDATSLRIVRANLAFTKVLGYSPDEIPGLEMRRVSGSEPRVWEANLAILVETGRIPLSVRPFHHKDGHIVEIESSVGRTVAGARVLYCVVGRDPTERHEAERVRREAELRMRTFVDAAFEGLTVTDKGRIIDANARLAEILREPLSALVGRPVIDFVAPESRADVIAHLGSGAPQFYEHHLLRADGTIIPVEVRAKTIDVGGRTLRVTAIRDVSERKSLEEQVRLAQRMESVGRLAGGVAHDFNNLLTVILSLAKFLSDRSASTRDREDLVEIESAALRAAELTQQLLAFARRQIVEPRVLDLNELVTSLDKMLRRVIGEHIELATIAMSNLGRIRADPGRIEQVLMNLVVNARDAMEGGGKLTIETANVELGADYAANHPDVEPGSYVMFSVSDTGGGMDPRTMSKIFEPFFTTKVPGKGTGLGLATCYGIVRQSGGSIWVYSEVGKGTTFKVYLPRVSDAAQELVRASASAAAHGHETLMVVEDDEMVRRVAVRILRAKGYVVHETGDPRAALAIFEQLGRAVDLLVADVVMSGMSGKDLADRLRGVKPNLRVLYTSGYTENTIVHHGVVDPDVNFLAKPYLPEDLARCVREALDKRDS